MHQLDLVDIEDRPNRTWWIQLEETCLMMLTFQTRHIKRDNDTDQLYWSETRKLVIVNKGMTWWKQLEETGPLDANLPRCGNSRCPQQDMCNSRCTQLNMDRNNLMMHSQYLLIFQDVETVDVLNKTCVTADAPNWTCIETT
ncbi:uncharacterized protein LOC134279503 [Saccostrea cucullata]|uniref:uncharacterized protein LOC134279503 n=1 Tax=Saccostrea cuccullata TaxID=36930 RepID=UPI002ED60DC8